MNKRGSKYFIVSVVLVVVLIVAAFLYYALYRPNNSGYYDDKQRQGLLKNPVEGLTDSEASAEFDETFVYYLLYSIKAYNLHNPPLSGNKPKILLKVGDDVYSAEISDGLIDVYKKSIENPDIKITTTKEEAVKMLRQQEYVTASFQNGGSSIEMLAAKSTLFGKGYLTLYNELTGKSVTGNVIRIYAD